jgi:nicotinamidase-related amidase
MSQQDENALPRNPELLSADECVLLVIDVQEKLVDLVGGHERLIANIGRLIDGAKILGVPVYGSEQYPRGLGPTTGALAEKLGPLPEKLSFSCGGCAAVMHKLAALDRRQVLLAGIEAHVCVLQTALDLLAAGYRVYVCVDAVGARHEIDYATALRRLEACGASLVTTEMALFEWCRAAGTPQFKQISALVKER